MPMTTATRERLTTAAVTLHHPLDYYFGIFLRAKETEGLKHRTLRDHKNHYRYLQRWLVEHHPTLKLEQLTADHFRQYVGYMLNEQTLYDGHPTLQSHHTAKGLSLNGILEAFVKSPFRSCPLYLRRVECDAERRSVKRNLRVWMVLVSAECHCTVRQGLRNRDTVRRCSNCKGQQTDVLNPLCN
jgi:hypothetical protein